MSDPSPRHEIAHLGHVELLTPEPEKSLDFFVRVRTSSEEALKRRVVALEERGLGVGWVDGDIVSPNRSGSTAA